MGKVSNIEIYRSLEAEKAKMSFIEKEKQAEIAYIDLITLRKSDIIESKKGKGLKKSLFSHVANWVKTLSDQDKDILFLMQQPGEAFDALQDYIIGKAKGKMAEKYECAFLDTDFREDVLKLIILEIYKHKDKKRAFCSARARIKYVEFKFYRETEQRAYEIAGRLTKYSLKEIKQHECCTREWLDSFKYEVATSIIGPCKAEAKNLCQRLLEQEILYFIGQLQYFDSGSIRNRGILPDIEPEKSII